MRRTLLILAAALSTTACAYEIAGPAPAGDVILHPGLDVSLTVHPAEVPQHGPFTARLTVTNTTSDTIRVGTAHGCLAVPWVFRNGEPVPFDGSWWACTAAGASHAFPPGETRSITWNMRAALYAQTADDVDGAPAPRGSYQVVAEFDTYLPGSPPGVKPRVEEPLRVR
jgi:hypothetical protein